MISVGCNAWGLPSLYCLTLNHTDAIDPKSVIETINYDHPAYSCASVDAQRRFEAINGKRRTLFLRGLLGIWVP